MLMQWFVVWFPVNFDISDIGVVTDLAAFVEKLCIVYAETCKLHTYVQQRGMETAAVSQSSGASPLGMPRGEEMSRRAGGDVCPPCIWRHLVLALCLNL